jgi:hypothetical protein
MSMFLTPRRRRASAGLAVLSVLALTPTVAQAAAGDVTGTLSSGGLSVSTPEITAFTAALTGKTQTVTTAVGTSQVVDATGSNAGWSVAVAATAPEVDGSGSAAGTGASLSLTPVTGAADAANPTTTGPLPVSADPVLLLETATTIQNAAAGTGQGAWNFPADATALSVVVPGNASAGAYTSILTYTTAAPVTA